MRRYRSILTLNDPRRHWVGTTRVRALQPGRATKLTAEVDTLLVQAISNLATAQDEDDDVKIGELTKRIAALRELQTAWATIGNEAEFETWKRAQRQKLGVPESDAGEDGDDQMQAVAARDAESTSEAEGKVRVCHGRFSRGGALTAGLRQSIVCACAAPYNAREVRSRRHTVDPLTELNARVQVVIGCDNPRCRIQWFHPECVGYEGVLGDSQPWLCPECMTPSTKGKKLKTSK